MYTLPDLGYGYDALGRYISKDIMELHHKKHHQSYVDKLNAALDGHDELQDRELVALISSLDTVPQDIRVAIRNHGGGHYNHSLFWDIMSPNGGGAPTGELAGLIDSKYGSFQGFVDEFTAKSLSVFGSGWAWLQPDGSVITTSNQDSPVMQGLDEPLLGLDVWEHAYYLDYKNKRDDYIHAWWNVIDWGFVASRLNK